MYFSSVWWLWIFSTDLNGSALGFVWHSTVKLFPFLKESPSTPNGNHANVSFQLVDFTHVCYYFFIFQEILLVKYEKKFL